MSDLPEPQSRLEELMVRQIQATEETNALLRDIKKRLPYWPDISDFADTVRAGSD